MQYSVTFVNNSNQAGTACLYQQGAGSVPNVMSLAWFTKFISPNTTMLFRWSLDYSFVWAETGVLVPGVVFDTGQLLPADPSSGSRVQFTQVAGGFTFEGEEQGGSPGSLSIQSSGTIPQNQAAVGIGMSGRGTFATQAQPNTNVVFTPRPAYWLAFGNFVQGQVLDVGRIPNPVRIDFPPGVYSITATLNRDNSWTIATTS
ncbi:MAG TPA: hypothetical protein VHG91_18540 [Longimicrobium sp.]|nr:hypothetical protein [Longimicrobium sp.]